MTDFATPSIDFFCTIVYKELMSYIQSKKKLIVGVQVRHTNGKHVSGLTSQLDYQLHLQDKHPVPTEQ
jgi:hypothetical protein